MGKWNRKHDKAAYIQSMRRGEKSDYQFRYGNIVHLGEGTDFTLFLQAISNGIVCYDPGIKLENASSGQPAVKRRSQFRIKINQIEGLYSSMREVNLLD